MTEKIHLCLVAPVPPPYGGIGNWVLLLKEHIKTRDDIDVDYISTAPVARGIDGRSLWERIVKQGLLIFSKCKELKKAIETNHPDVIHITTSGQLAVFRDIMLLKTARKKGIPTIYHIRFGRIKDISEKSTIEWRLLSMAMKLASEVIAIDRTTFDAIKARLNSVKVVYIPNPIDLSNLPQPKRNNNKIVIFLGWVIKTKGIEELLLAWKNIHKIYPEWQLKLVGPSKEEYFTYLKAKYCFDGVFYEGEKKHDEAMTLLNDSEIFILPSYTEGFPNVVLEAMALQKPVIATCVGAIPDMLSDDCGIIINQKDVNVIAVALSELISNIDRRTVLYENAYKKLICEFTIENIFAKYMDVWHKLSS